MFISRPPAFSPTAPPFIARRRASLLSTRPVLASRTRLRAAIRSGTRQPGAVAVSETRRERAMRALPGLLALGALLAACGALEPGGGIVTTGGMGWLGRTLGALWSSWTVRVFIIVYAILFALLLVSHRAQTWLIYLHWLRPPSVLHRPDDVHAHGLSGVARSIQAGHLRGWHLTPPGPPFARVEEHFENRLAMPGARVILFFHGNSGTRAFPPRRVRVVSTLAAQFRAHVIAFDYSGFADTPGRPSELQLYKDARSVYAWTRARTAPDARVVLYGQSLGSFAAVDLAAHLSRERERDMADGRLVALVLESAPASLVEAARSHPTVAPFRILPGIDTVFRNLLKERLDSVSKIQDVVFPLLVMHGDADTLITPSQGRMLYEKAVQAGNDHAQLVMFPRCGHNNVSASEGYLSTVNDFLERYAPLP